MKTPRYVVLLSAGIAMCRSSFDEARARYSDAMNTWGRQGLDHPSHPAAEDGNPVTSPWRRGYREPECDLYRALTSALTGVERDSLQCPGGLRPVHNYMQYTTVILVESETDPGEFVKQNVDVIVWDNPLTPGDESLTPPDHWNQQPGIKGTSPEVGEDNTGDPGDEFDVPEQPLDTANERQPAEPAPVAAAVAEAATTVAPAEATPAEAAPAQPATADELASTQPGPSEAAPAEAAPVDEPSPAQLWPAEQPPPEASVSAAEPSSPPAEPATAEPAAISAESGHPAPTVP
ncbi:MULTISPECIES: hypothetical protein [Microbacterium]|uniref:hypothetical protein n=1 Tax=Microbacterium TaxID=33882 RepID=UPI000D6510E3|nr:MULTISPECIES: hypothetical protein [Microbacterium]